MVPALRFKVHPSRFQNTKGTPQGAPTQNTFLKRSKHSEKEHDERSFNRVQGPSYVPFNLQNSEGTPLGKLLHEMPDPEGLFQTSEAQEEPRDPHSVGKKRLTPLKDSL